MPEYYFSLPTFESLNPSQQSAVTDNNAIALSGGPGTGKSVVSLWRHILNHQRENPIRSQLLTYTTSLALYLKKCCHTTNTTASNFVDSSKNWYFNNACDRAEIIHDEAQDLHLAFNKSLSNYSNIFSYGADNRQLISAQARSSDGAYNCEKCSPEEKLRSEFPNNSFHELSRNYRNSKKILKLAKRLFSHLPEGPSIPQELIDSCPIEGEFPRLIVTGHNLQKISNAVLQLVGDFAGNETINIGILVPFEKPNSHAGTTAIVKYYYDLLIANHFECSKYSNGMGGIQEIKNIHVTTFKSAKGLEFDVVILPDFNLVDFPFKVVDWRDFYVGVTRTKSNLFLISRTDFPNLPANGINQIIEKVVL
jgi:superfamily I DNA/RNA helicase